MDLITLIIALSLYQVVRPGSLLQRDDWLYRADERLSAVLENSLLRAGALLLLILLLLGWTLAELEGWWFGLVPITVAVAMLVWALGHDDYHTELERQLAAKEDNPTATETTNSSATGQQKSSLWMPEEDTFAPDAAALSREHNSLNRRVLYAGYARWFPPVLYFLLFGPAMAVGYRAVSLLAAKEADRSETVYNNILFYFDWLPVRAVAATCALVGDFTAVFRANVGELLLSTKGAPELLEIVANASVDQVNLKTQSELLYRCSGLWLLLIVLILVLS